MDPILRPPPKCRVSRLGAADLVLARQAFSMMAEVFETEHLPLSDAYVERLLARADFWVLVASVDEEVVGALTGHALPLTSREAAELFIYDIAVRPSHQRKGVGRRLVEQLRALAGDAGIAVAFVPADDEDQHALEFYRALGGVASPVTFFTFGDA